jgi:hypothetical protein
MTQTCGSCARWNPPATRHTSLGSCLLLTKGVEKYADEKCFSWGWVPASSEQMESRVKAGLIKTEEVGA